MALSDYIIDELIANAVNDRNFTVVDRAQLELIRTEQNFQWSGEVDDRQALEVGRFFGAQYIISGAFSELGERYRMRIRALNVQTAQVQGQYNRNIQSGATITALMRNRSGGSSVASYGSRTERGTSTENTTADTRQTTQTQPVQQRGAAAGTYTFFPRLRATLAGVAINTYIDKVVVTSDDYIVFYFTNSPQGAGYPPGGFYSGGGQREDYMVQDLDNPTRFYNSVNFVTGGGGGTISTVSFRRFPATRIKLTTRHTDAVFNEIDLTKAEYTP